MTSLSRHLVACALLCTATASLAATMEDPLSKQILAAMDRSATWGHPDEENEFAGMQHYANHDYAGAMQAFLQAARYADKLSQLSIGLMYLNGEGVAQDPVMAYAWVALAAERKYPQFVATRDALWSKLDASQREKATVAVGKLSAEYGDAVAKPRMELALRQAREQMTGSLVGYGASQVETISPDQFEFMAKGGGLAGRHAACGAPTVDQAPVQGCGNLYAQYRWDPKKYFQIRDGMWTGTVTVGTEQRDAQPSSTH
ncbi:sel1 repeat family protein [Dyella sp. 20L07]|uniref:sel1 repeat family protein n=1 Tax=Dyella sp. 20L07 TaxID=3384240 RepID=UPI003D2E67BB